MSNSHIQPIYPHDSSHSRLKEDKERSDRHHTLVRPKIRPRHVLVVATVLHRGRNVLQFGVNHSAILLATQVHQHALALYCKKSQKPLALANVMQICMLK